MGLGRLAAIAVKKMSIDEHDKRVIRCRMLGHEVSFGYCRSPGNALPCRKICDCWFETFDVEEFLKGHFSEEQIQQILAAPKPKLMSIVDLIRQAKQNNQPDK